MVAFFNLPHEVVQALPLRDNCLACVNCDARWDMGAKPPTEYCDPIATYAKFWHEENA